MTSFSVIPPTPEWMTVTRTSVCWIFWSSDSAASTEPTTSPLTMRFRSWTASVREHPLEGQPRLGRLGKLLGAQPLAAQLREVSRLPLVLDHAAELASRRRMVEAEDLDGVTRLGALHLLAAEVV